MAAISAAAATSDAAFAAYADKASGQVVEPLRSVRFTHAAPGKTAIDVDDLIDALNETDACSGFTLSPRTAGEDVPVFASEGICVALPGADLHLTFDTEDDRPTDAPYDDLRMFLSHLKPLLDTGHVWIGGWKDPQGRIEINATVVFREEDQPHAARLAHQWEQQGVYHLSRDQFIETGGEGGESIYDNKPGRLRNWYQQRRQSHHCP